MAMEWDQRGLEVITFPQHDGNMIRASQVLHDAVVEGRLVHPDDEQLNAHVAAAVAKHALRGWRISKAERSENIDGVIALAMAVDRALAPKPPPARFLGFLGEPPDPDLKGT
jgi:phage terminase large subunit-like protein